MTTLPRYPIMSVDPGAEREHEQMGSKTKFWFKDGDAKWLFKRRRANTGEDWAEKLGAEVAALLGLPHAKVELAESEGLYGSASLDFVGRCDLIHGNELLLHVDSSYPAQQLWRVTEYTVENVLGVLTSTALSHRETPVTRGMTAAAVFVGYLALDALIGNTDRHHENWGLLRDGEQVSLAPTYDHASSLGRELQDRKRRALLADHQVAKYTRKARSALYASSSARRPMSPLDAFLLAAKSVPGSRATWQTQTASLSRDALHQIIQRVHPERMSQDARDFAFDLLLENQRALCAETTIS
ncbi:MAG TPA: HipA-like protein [Nannocystis exedens]|nr:HipA-like protein [Nannocystis exedens]